MSYRLFHGKMLKAVGKQHTSRTKFAETMAKEYHKLVMRHFDVRSAGGKPINLAPKVPMLKNGILAICEQDLGQHGDVNWIQQLEPYIMQYWTGAIIVGPTGTTTVMNTGKWKAPKVKQNLNFNIILRGFEKTAKIHLMTMTGLYKSRIRPKRIYPWSGAMLKTMG